MGIRSWFGRGRAEEQQYAVPPAPTERDVLASLNRVNAMLREGNAPPVVMAAYSARLALKTTMVGLLFSATALADSWVVPAVLAVPLLCWSGLRLVRTADLWSTPDVRARIVAVVAT